MKKILIIKTGSTHKSMIDKYGDFEKWMTGSLHPNEYLVVNVEKGERLPEFAECSGVMVTGSHSMVSDMEDWSEKTAAWIKEYVETGKPLLGICYGHQLLAHALGGKVEYHKDGMEAGTVEILLKDVQDDALFKDMPKKFPAHAVHSQTVTRLPDGAECLAYNDFEPHHAFRYGRSAWGVQFHPEFSADVMKDYISMSSEKLKSQHKNPDDILKTVRETPQAESLLSRFEEICRG
jgi:GMP synthase (glutamine-hydrolysing)